MATFKYFTTCEAEQVELSHVYFDQMMYDVTLGRERATERPYAFIGSCKKCGAKHVAQRKIEWKKNPSFHQCNAKCMGGKANGACECRCGGKNHGAGAFSGSNLFREAA